ncbi:nitrogen regulation protein NR(II) [Desulfitobacterium sp. Sab5]|uniref:two-component system sensor histidine kinase NtrB n=1 Tax=Desulfitobacterium nosdiversum TaxID=3375356 RepID=UPI003CF6D7C5
MIKLWQKQPIIQVTLFKIIGILFIFIIIVVTLFGETYWEKQTYKENYQLVLMASNLQTKISPYILGIENIEQNPNLTEQQKKAKIKTLIQPLLQSNGADVTAFGYYDLGLDFHVVSKEPIIAQIQSKLGNGNEFYHYTWNDSKNKDFVVSYPLYAGERIVGYSWAYADSTYNLFQSTFSISGFSIFALGLVLMIVILLQRYMTKIRVALDQFSQMITSNDYGQIQMLSKLPELKPVIDKIFSFTEELKYVNHELELSQQKITQIIEGVSDGVFALDRSYRFSYLNPKALRLTGQELHHLLETKIQDVFPQIEDSLTLSKLEEAMAQNNATHWESKALTHPDFCYEYHAYPFTEGLTVFFRDITESKRHSQELARLERLNLIGQLAAGISHEIRNPLTTVKGFLQFLGARKQYESEKEYIDLMVSEIDRANSIITDFLSLAKVNSDNIRLKNINEIIGKIFPMLQADAYNNNKEILLDLKSLPEIMLNENEIKQLILNLVRNGLEAMPEKGKVTIRTYCTENNVILEIEDQGAGIPEEIREKIGTPFFTTKETGTGLGMAISIGIAQRHHALFDFETGRNGTTFKITFNTADSICEI